MTRRICLLLAMVPTTAFSGTPRPAIYPPLAFERNDGQADPEARFLTRASGQTVFLTSTGAVISSRDGSQSISMRLANASAAPAILGERRLPGAANYFRRGKPRTGIPAYEKVRYRHVYPGIDLVFHGNGQKLEYDFEVDAGADPSRIVIVFEDRVGQPLHPEIDEKGGLRIGEVHFDRPVLKQSNREVAGGYTRLENGAIAFTIAEYDHSKPLLIDPVLGFSTYMGGNGAEEGSPTTLAVDAGGNIYLAGVTTSVDFPINGPVQPNLRGLKDAYVMKLNAAGTQILFSTYLGGTADDFATGVAVDTSGVYVTGHTDSANFPVFQALQPAKAGGTDGFLTKLNPAGSAILFSTFFGGGLNDFPTTIKVDPAGAAYLAGTTRSVDFPTTPGSFNPGALANFDAFVTKFVPGGAALAYSTRFGGFMNDRAASIVVDSAGNATVTGSTNSMNFPLQNPADATFGGGFLAKLNATGTGLIFSTHVPGQGNSVAAHPQGNIFVGIGRTDVPQIRVYTASGQLVTLLPNDYPFGVNAIAILPDGTQLYVLGNGDTGSILPATAGPLGGNDFFLASWGITANGSGIDFNTGVRIGGSLNDTPHALVLDQQGLPVISGSTLAADYPVNTAIQSSLRGASDNFVTRVVFGSDLRLTASGPSEAGVGELIDYNLGVTNLGPDAAAYIRVRSTLPPGMTLISATVQNGICSGSTVVTCDRMMPLNVMGVWGITLRVRAGNSLGSGSISSVASIFFGSEWYRDYNLLNNSASVFTATKFRLSITGAGPFVGNVTSSPTGINCAILTQCTALFPGGATVTLTAVGNPGHPFIQWTGGGCTGTNPVCVVRMDQSRTVGVRFQTFPQFP